VSRSDVAVRLDGVSRTYRTATGEVPALRDVSAAFGRGLVTAVVGPSGSGKSSLLRLVAGLDRPSDGRLFVDDVDVGRGSSRTRRRLRRDLVGYVYQRPSDNFIPHLTVGEHLRLVAPRGEERRDPLELLDLLEIGHRLDHLPSELSGGEQQRAAFAQALSTPARVIVADEPTAELDTRSGQDVLDRVRALAAAGITFVLATHDPDVIAIADEHLVLEGGRVRARDRLARRETADETPPLRWPTPGVAAWLVDEDPTLRIQQVSKTYGHGEERVQALQDVSLDARGGEVVGVIGRSGSGKTTLLNVAAGWETPDAGTVVAPGSADPGWRDVAVLPQRLGLLEELSAQENIEYPARVAGLLDERRDLVEDLIGVLGLTAFRARYPRETSLGEQQRTALARALVMQPTLLIADEPTGHQDAGWALTIMRVLREAAGAGTCCLIATHDPALIEHLDRNVHLSDGRLQGDATRPGV
jgi:putative ABC transport system ATP-binding protein